MKVAVEVSYHGMHIVKYAKDGIEIVRHGKVEAAIMIKVLHCLSLYSFQKKRTRSYFLLIRE